MSARNAFLSHTSLMARLPAGHSFVQAAKDAALGQHPGILALDRSRPEEALPHLRQALTAFQRARDEHGQMRGGWLNDICVPARANRADSVVFLPRACARQARITPPVPASHGRRTP